MRSEKKNSLVAKMIKNLDVWTDEIADAIVDTRLKNHPEEVIEVEDVFLFDSCISFCKKYQTKISTVSGFVLSVKRNQKPQNENDIYIITIGLVDKNDNPITRDGKHAICRVVHAADIDNKTMIYLDGDDTRIFTIR